MDVNNQNASPFDCADWFLKEILSAPDSEGGLQDDGGAIVYHSMAQAAPEDASLVNVQLAKLEESVGDSFLDDDLERVFIEHIRGVRTALKSVTNSLEDETDFRANGEQRLLAYLDRYMELLYQTLANWEILQQALNARKFCRLIVNLGCVFLGAQYSCAGNMTPFAPPYVAALLETSRQLIRFQNATETLPDGDIREQIVAVKWETLCLRLFRYMRWFTVSPENELCRIVLNADSLPAIVPLRHSDGYEPIDATSLLEKNHFELERKQFDPSCAVFRVLIVGDWNAAQFRLLKNFLPKNFKLHFTLLTRSPKNMDDGENLNAPNERVIWETKSYADFWGKRNNFLSLVKASDLSFFLDCKELYSRLRIKPERDLSAFLQWPRTENYTALRNRLESSGVSYLPGNKFFKMRDLLVGAAYNDVLGCLDKSVNESFFQILERGLKDENGRFARTAYVYYSDIFAAKTLCSSATRFVRSETHAGKKFSVLRLGERRDQPLADARGDTERKIVFHLWRFVKHIMPSNMETTARYFGLDADAFECARFLSRVFVGVDYRNGFKRLALSYDFPDAAVARFPQLEEKLRDFLEYVVKPCFVMDDAQNLIYSRYYRDCITSFLYSDAKSADDMLFLDALNCFPNQIKAVSIVGREQLSAPSDFRAKYSDKDVYQELIEELSYRTAGAWFPAALQNLNEESSLRNRAARRVLETLATSCERNCLEDSFLYQICRHILNNLFS